MYIWTDASVFKPIQMPIILFLINSLTVRTFPINIMIDATKY